MSSYDYKQRRKLIPSTKATPEIIALIIKRREEGLTYAQIGVRLGISKFYANELYLKFSKNK